MNNPAPAAPHSRLAHYPIPLFATVMGTSGLAIAWKKAGHVLGLPAEIGLWLAHRALTESGLRDDVELWCDGGMKSGRDVVKTSEAAPDYRP